MSRLFYLATFLISLLRGESFCGQEKYTITSSLILSDSTDGFTPCQGTLNVNNVTTINIQPLCLKELRCPWYVHIQEFDCSNFNGDLISDEKMCCFADLLASWEKVYVKGRRIRIGYYRTFGKGNSLNSLTINITGNANFETGVTFPSSTSTNCYRTTTHPPNTQRIINTKPTNPAKTTTRPGAVTTTTTTISPTTTTITTTTSTTAGTTTSRKPTINPFQNTTTSTTTTTTTTTASAAATTTTATTPTTKNDSPVTTSKSLTPGFRSSSTDKDEHVTTTTTNSTSTSTDNTTAVPPNEKSSSSIGTKEMAGIAVGVLLLVILCIVILVCIRHRRKRYDEMSNSTDSIDKKVDDKNEYSSNNYKRTLPGRGSLSGTKKNLGFDPLYSDMVYSRGARDEPIYARSTHNRGRELPPIVEEAAAAPSAGAIVTTSSNTPPPSKMEAGKETAVFVPTSSDVKRSDSYASRVVDTQFDFINDYPC